MLSWLRQLLFWRQLAKRSRLIELARRTDELLMGSNTLSTETRELLRQRRENLESEIRALSVT